MKSSTILVLSVFYRMEVNYQAESGGFRELRNTDQEYSHYDTQNYTGLKDIKQVAKTFSDDLTKMR